MQLDSWWYQKTRIMANGQDGGPKNPKLPEGSWNAYGGTMSYTASPDLFSDGLAQFHDHIGLPFIVHNRWIDPTSPYHDKYRFSAVAAIDPQWWEDIASYLQANGIIGYEQDWLSEIYRFTPDMATHVEVGNAFTDGMARGCRDHGIDMQYCMAMPRFFLQGAQYDNLTTIRVSGDRFEPKHWEEFFYTSHLASALGMWPWTDVFNSTEHDNLLLSVLSAGPVGIGDAVGKESPKDIFHAIRKDGVIVKPDTPIRTSDQTFLSDARNEHRPLLAWTYTDHSYRTVYLFSFVRPGDIPEVEFRPASFGLSGTVWVYPQGRRVNANDTVRCSGTQFVVLAPEGPSGIAFLGDQDKFVGTGKQRIATLRDRNGALEARILFATDETVLTLHGLSMSRPTAQGPCDPVSWDPHSRHFTVRVHRPASGMAFVRLKSKTL